MIIIRPETKIALCVRSDKAGDGSFGASRGRNKAHRGVDVLVKEGDRIHSPVRGTVSKYGICYADDEDWKYIEIQENISNHYHRFFYLDLRASPKVGEFVNKGDFIGVAMDITDRYPSIGMHPHIHYEVKTEDGRYLDPDIFNRK